LEKEEVGKITATIDPLYDCHKRFGKEVEGIWLQETPSSSTINQKRRKEEV